MFMRSKFSICIFLLVVLIAVFAPQVLLAPQGPRLSGLRKYLFDRLPGKHFTPDGWQNGLQPKADNIYGSLSSPESSKYARMNLKWVVALSVDTVYDGQSPPKQLPGEHGGAVVTPSCSVPDPPDTCLGGGSLGFRVHRELNSRLGAKGDVQLTVATARWPANEGIYHDDVKRYFHAAVASCLHHPRPFDLFPKVFKGKVDFTEVAECMNSTLAWANNIQPRLTMVGNLTAFAKAAGQGHIFHVDHQPTKITLENEVVPVPGPLLSILMVMGPPPRT